MSRLGDLLRTERLRRKMTLKQVAKIGGVSESYLKDVEEGTRIIGDDQARRILKKIGLQEHNEEGFTLDDIASTVDLETVTPKQATPKPVETKKATLDSETVYQSRADENEKQVGGGIWLDALTSVLKRVPVYNAVLKEIDHRLLPILDGRIEGAAPDKVYYLCAPDDGMRGFRILKDDLCLIAPSNSPIDGAVMLVEHNQHRYLRKVKKLDAVNVLLQSYDREYAAETCALPEISILGRVVRVEFTL
ncbi:MAG: LexA family transcriptional regulator [Clostridia bacterium]